MSSDTYIHIYIYIYITFYLRHVCFVFVGTYAIEQLTFTSFNGGIARRWKNGGKDGTWTDGSAAVGNGMVFTVHNNELPGVRANLKTTKL